MTLTQIEVFCAVAELGSMTLASERLNMTQPGVSRTISEIEHEFDIQLFIREKKSLHITPQGKICYERAIKVLKEAEILKSNLSRSRKMEEISVGCSSGLAPFVLKQASVFFNKKYPSCILRITEDHPSVIKDGINNGIYNVGFIQQKLRDVNLDDMKIGGDKIVLVAAKNYVLNQKKNVYTIEDIAKEKLVFIKKGSGIRHLIDSYAESQFVNLKPLWNCNSGEHALALVEDGFGVSLLSNKTVDESIRQNRIIELKTDFNITRDYFAIWRRICFLSDEEKYLINVCKQIAQAYTWENSPLGSFSPTILSETVKGGL